MSYSLSKPGRNSVKPTNHTNPSKRKTRKLINQPNNKFKNQFGENGSFRLVDSDEMNDPENNPKDGLFSHTDDFIKLAETARKFPAINEIEIKNAEHYSSLIELTTKDEDIVPIFLKMPSGSLEIIPSFSNDIEDIKEGSKLVAQRRLKQR